MGLLAQTSFKATLRREILREMAKTWGFGPRTPGEA